MVGRGRFARTIASRRLIELPAGNSIRRKMFGGQIRGAYGLFNRGDLGWVTGGYTADCVIELPAFAPVGLSTRVSGIDEVREILSEIRESLAVTYFPREIVDPGGSTIAGRAELKIVGGMSGIELATDHWNIWTISEGRVAFQRIDTDRDAILEQLAAGG